jgi:hypothetical protein
VTQLAFNNSICLFLVAELTISGYKGFSAANHVEGFFNINIEYNLISIIPQMQIQGNIPLPLFQTHWLRLKGRITEGNEE